MMSMQEAAESWGVSYSTVRKWLAQGRIFAKRGGRTIIILSEERPERVHPGDLTPASRAQWDYGRGYRPGAKG